MLYRKLYFFIMAVLGVFLFSCTTVTNYPGGTTLYANEQSATVTMQEGLKAILTKELKKSASVPGAIIYVDAPMFGLSSALSVGYSERSERTELLPQQPVRFASNTKTFVAAAILRLWEDGKLELDAAITEYISRDSAEILKAGGYSPNLMTIRQLLTHTSGLFDYAESAPYDRAILKNPGRRWTRRSQLQGAVQWGRPVGKPGEVFNYSDTGYILAGEILERVTGLPLPIAVRNLIDFDSIGIENTWWETLEPVPSSSLKRAHQYWKRLDSYSWDPSFDLYGGGGLAGPLEDLGRFMRALFSKEVFQHDGTLQLMITGTGSSLTDSGNSKVAKWRDGFGMGIRTTQIKGLISYQHAGAWGTVAAYFPEIDAVIVVAITQLSSKSHYKILQKAVELLKRSTIRKPVS